MRYRYYGILQIGVYLFLAMTPLLVLLTGHDVHGRGFWRELAVGLGFGGVSMMGLQFFLTGRFQGITSPYGIDVVYYFHRAISLVAFVFLLFHPSILLLSAPATFGLLNPLSAPGWMTAGTIALFVFALIVGSSLFRLKLGLGYEQWRLLHGFAAVTAVALALWHMIGVNYYLQGYVKRGLWIALAITWVMALLYVRLVKPLLMRSKPYTVESVTKERGKSWTLVLRPEGHGGMEFKPGQFAWLTIDRSPFSIREHPFSFSSSAMHPERLAFTIKELGDFTATIGSVAPGTRTYVDGPYGSFIPDRHLFSGYVFIAGGVGITPIMSILRTFADRHDLRPLILFYAGRQMEELTFREELDRLQERLKLRVVHVINCPPAGWTGEQGYIDAEMMGRYLPEGRMAYEYFVCGPIPMQQGAREALEKLGVPPEQVQSESFNFV
ncbi:MAG: ferric reductase-like transmembrane domain-containing protein [Desulfurivibrionaceae bacterium]|nr:ferric reductase-like transmembrane domain-containing protein [Desulfurivibrionaceae bacterium]